MKPLLILDVDGTLLPHVGVVDVNAVPDIPLERLAWVKAASATFDVVWATMRSADVMVGINSVHDIEADVIGLEWAPDGPPPPGALNHKTEQVARWVIVRGARPFVWADDLITDVDAEHLYRLKQAGRLDEHLLVAPRPEAAMTDVDLSRILDWARSPWTRNPDVADLAPVTPERKSWRQRAFGSR